MAERVVFLTGRTGFIGTRFAAQATNRAFRARSLVRGRSALAAHEDAVVGDLRAPDSYRDALRGCDTVVHLAAVTGKASPEDYFATNVDGTRALVDACTSAGVRRIVYVSSIAATYRDKSAYPYARSKEAAEQIVRASGLDYVIVRPTIVLGSDSPIWKRLRALATLTVVPVPGGGSVRIQPIHVDDVAAFLCAMAAAPALPGRAIDLGGPDVMTFEEFLVLIHRVVRGDRPWTVHLRVRWFIRLLSGVERWVGPILPISAGQLSAFVNESIAREDPLVAATLPRMKTMDDTVRALAAHG
jgi:nucleoside-diphosphate-sugar epimerase